MVEEKETLPAVQEDKIQLATASVLAGGVPPFGESFGTFYMPYGDLSSSFGNTPEKLIVPKNFHQVTRMAYDFYQRGGAVSTVINRIAEFAITDIRNGQRDTTDEENAYYEAILHSQPSRLMRFLRTVALEYFLSGMVLPRVDWVEKRGDEISPDLIKSKTYKMPVFDMYSPLLVRVVWANWGNKKFYLKVPSSDIRLIRSSGAKTKDQQVKLKFWNDYFPDFIQNVKSGGDNEIELREIDPILRKEISISPYPTPYLFSVLEPMIYKQQLRRMDFAVASRVINAILLVQEGDKDFPLTAENQKNLDDLKNQIQARSGNPLLLERLFMLFSNHTTKLTWITPDVDAMLSQEKYQQVNEDIQEGLGFTRVLLTGDSRQAQASEVSTYSIQPQMEELRSNLLEWIKDLYWKASEINDFENKPEPSFKPIRLQDFVKTAAIFAQAFKEGNISRTTRAESIGTDFETETELMNDEKDLMKGLPPYQPTPYSPLPPMMNAAGRPIGSQNVPVNNRNSGVKPPDQSPTSKIAASSDAYIVDETFVTALMEDDEVIELMNQVATDMGIKIGAEDIIEKE